MESEGGDTISGRAVLELRDLERGLAWALRRNVPAMRFVLPTGVGLIAAGVLAMGIGVVTRGRPIEFALVPVFFGLALLGVAWRARRLPAEHHARMTPGQRDLEYRIGPDGVQLRNAAERVTDYPWERITGFASTDDALMLAIARNVVVVPWRAFASSEDRERALAMIAKHVTAAPPRRMSAWLWALGALALWGLLVAVLWAAWGMLGA